MKSEANEMERVRVVDLEHVEEFRFRLHFGAEMPEIVADEPPPLGGGSGPDAARLLAGAIGNCLSASLLLCLRKARVELRSLRTNVRLTIGRNDEGRLRVQRGDVRIEIDADAGAGRLDRCFGVFEQYCTVTASIRRAIPVSVEVRDVGGVALHRSAGEPAAV